MLVPIIKFHRKVELGLEMANKMDCAGIINTFDTKIGKRVIFKLCFEIVSCSFFFSSRIGDIFK